MEFAHILAPLFSPSVVSQLYISYINFVEQGLVNVAKVPRRLIV